MNRRFISRRHRVLVATVALVATPFVTMSSSVNASINAATGSCTTGTYNETTDGGDTIGIFTSTGNAVTTDGCEWNVPSGVNSVRVLVVAGGGGAGGYHTSGGGGAGGLIHDSSFDVTPGTSIDVVVGRGGAPGSRTWNTALNPGSNGADSEFGSLVAIGGGGGGGGGTNSQIGNPGLSGGSGGGGGRCWVNCNTSHTEPNQNFRSGGSATSGQGFAGGKTHFMAAAGGGGAGERGGDGGEQFVGGISVGGDGGDGLQFDISGTNTWYAGGGAGGSEANTDRAPGGSGGGGDGATGKTGLTIGQDADPHTGGGGGGTNWADGGDAGHGGSGIVIVRWGSSPSAPAFTITQASSWVEVNSSITSLYTINNTGGSISRFSVSPALPVGVTLNTSTGEVSGSPTSTQSQTTYTLTAIRTSASNGATSRTSRTFSLGVYSGTIPTTTTTVVQSVSVNTDSSTEENADLAATESAQTPSTNTGSSLLTQRITSATTTPRASAMTTTVPATTTTSTTTTTIPAPTAPDVSSGEAGVLVNGEEVDTTLTRSNNALVVSAAGIEASIYGMTDEGTRVDLDEDGFLRLATSDQIVVDADGFNPGDEVDIWMYSTPTRLGTVEVDANGALNAMFTLPAEINSGDHRVVLDGKNGRGQDVIVGVGIAVGQINTSSLFARLLIIVPVSAAILIALIIPTRLRRRREEALA